MRLRTHAVYVLSYQPSLGRAVWTCLGTGDELAIHRFAIKLRKRFPNQSVEVRPYKPRRA